MQLISQELHFDKFFTILSPDSKILQTDVAVLFRKPSQQTKTGNNSRISHMTMVFSPKSVNVINSNIRSSQVKRWLDHNL